MWYHKFEVYPVLIIHSRGTKNLAGQLRGQLSWAGLGCGFHNRPTALTYVACVHDSTNGTNGLPISFNVLPMVPLVIPLVPMVPLVKTVGSQYFRQSTV